MKTWAQRIEEARKRGEFTTEDKELIGDYKTCLVGEALREIGVQNVHAAVENDAEGPGGLVLLGLCCSLLERNLPDALESRRLKIRARGAELYGPSDESLILETVEAVKRHAQEKELVTV